MWGNWSPIAARRSRLTVASPPWTITMVAHVERDTLAVECGHSYVARVASRRGSSSRVASIGGMKAIAAPPS